MMTAATLRHLRFWFRPAGLVLLIAASSPLLAQTPADISALLDRVAARIESYASTASWTATVTNTRIETDRKWNPEKTTVITKTVSVVKGRREETILKAEVTEDGRTKDITAQYIADLRAQREKERARRAAQPQTKPQAGNRNSRRMSRGIEDLLPFAPERRPAFSFNLRETRDADGRPLALLDVKAKVKDPNNWEGTYTIDPETGDALKAVIKPSETPSMVKELEVEAEAEIFAGPVFIPKRTWYKVNGGFLFIKRVRMISEEIYSDIRITDGAEPRELMGDITLKRGRAL
jgi:hypothetical protein